MCAYINMVLKLHHYITYVLHKYSKFITFKLYHYAF